MVAVALERGDTVFMFIRRVCRACPRLDNAGAQRRLLAPKFRHVDHPSSRSAELGLDFVGAERGAGLQRHGLRNGHALFEFLSDVLFRLQLSARSVRRRGNAIALHLAPYGVFHPIQGGPQRSEKVHAFVARQKDVNEGRDLTPRVGQEAANQK